MEEPPELTGQPKTLQTASEALRQFGRVMGKWKEKDPETIKALRPELDNFIRQHPDYSDAYTIRAVGDLAYVKTRDYANIVADIKKAISTLSPKKGDNMFDLGDLYAFRAKQSDQV